MSTLENRPKTALLVIDVQEDVVAGAHLRDTVVANVGSLVEKARREQVPVVWVQHSDQDLERGSAGWQIVPELKPAEAEPLVEKNYGDSFEETSLERVLADLEVGRLRVVGAQTDACIRSTQLGSGLNSGGGFNMGRFMSKVRPRTISRPHPHRARPGEIARIGLRVSTFAAGQSRAEATA